MCGVKYLCIACVVFLLIVATSGQNKCGRRLLANFRLKPVNPASISVTLRLSTACEDKDVTPVRYQILYGMNNGFLSSIMHNYTSASTNEEIILSDLSPQKRYMVLVIVEYSDGGERFSRAKFMRSGANSTDPPVTNPPIDTNSTSVGGHNKASSAGGIAAGVVIFLFALVMAAIIISVWLIKRRRKLINKNKGSHYVSVVSTIGNESTIRKKLYSRPGYLQIFHDAKPGNYEVPVDSVNIVPNTRVDPAGLEYLTGSEERPSITDADVMMMKTQPIQPLSANMTTVTTSKPHTHKSAQVKKKKLVKPYAVVDMADIAAKAGLEDDTVTKPKSKHQRNKHVPTNREALSHSFGAHTRNSTTTQVELNGRFYTVPIYVNLHIPMTINPSYNK